MKGLSSDYTDILREMSDKVTTKRELIKRIEEIAEIYESYAMFYEAMAAAAFEVAKVFKEEVVKSEELN